MLSRVKNACI